MLMKLIGYAGFQEEGANVNLYQCQKCKAIAYSTSDPHCDTCHGVGEGVRFK